MVAGIGLNLMRVREAKPRLTRNVSADPVARRARHGAPAAGGRRLRRMHKGLDTMFL